MKTGAGSSLGTSKRRVQVTVPESDSLMDLRQVGADMDLEDLKVAE
jgi:hypothetical protein